MYQLTQNEIKGLKALALIIILGAMFQCLSKAYPELLNLINLSHSPYSYLKIDVNTATRDELINIPYIGAFTADKIIQRRDIQGPYKSVEQLKDIKGIRLENFQRFSVYLKAGARE